MGMNRTVNWQIDATVTMDETFHGRISGKTGMTSRCNPISRDQTKSRILQRSSSSSLLCNVARCDGWESHDRTNPGVWNPAGFQPNDHGRWSKHCPWCCVSATEHAAAEVQSDESRLTLLFEPCSLIVTDNASQAMDCFQQ